MSTRASAGRYARALLDVAIKESEPESVERDLAAFVDLLDRNPHLYTTLTHPTLPVSGKRGIAEALLARLMPVTPVGKLLLLLADRDRFGLVRDLLAVYRERLRDHQQVVNAEVTTATPLTAEMVTALTNQLAGATGRRVTMTTAVEPALLGGVVARIGSTVYDGSVATQLSRLREKLST